MPDILSLKSSLPFFKYQVKELNVKYSRASQRASEKNESNFEYHEKGPPFRMYWGLRSPWEVTENSDFGIYVHWSAQKFMFR